MRKALLGESHTVVSIIGQEKKTPKDAFLEKYAAAGLTIATPFGDAAPEVINHDYRFWYDQFS